MKQLKSFLLGRAEFLSPKDLVQRAGAISAMFLILHLAGLREFTSILNGTIGSLAIGRNLSTILAMIYIVFYLGFVVAVPVMVMAAALLSVTQWLRRKSANAAGPETVGSTD